MVLGQDEEIDESTRQDWRDSGLSHLLAVSGQNVMLLVALALPLLALARTGPLIRGLALLAVVAVSVAISTWVSRRMAVVEALRVGEA